MHAWPLQAHTPGCNPLEDPLDLTMTGACAKARHTGMTQSLTVSHVGVTLKAAVQVPSVLAKSSLVSLKLTVFPVLSYCCA